MTRTFYDVLGVDAGASRERLEAAYREKVKETHPDVSDAADAESRFKRVKRAREVLTDEDERARYDRLGHARYVGMVDGILDPSGADTVSTDGDADAGGPDGGPTTDADATSAEAAGATTGATGPGTAGGGTTGTGATGGTSDGRTARTGATAGGTADAAAGSGETAGTGTTSSATGGAGTTSSATGGTGTTSSATGPHHGPTGRGYQPGGRGGAASAPSQPTWEQSLRTVRESVTAESAVEFVAFFVLYPIFLLAAVFPGFPLWVNVVVGSCTLFSLVYLLSRPAVGIVVFGTWSVLTPVALFALPGLSVVTFYGVVALLACLFPFGLAVLTTMALRT
jgi:curved DNA-binding protein CbpA